VVGNKNFSSKIQKFISKERIGPHNTDIISIIVGSTLGDSYLEKRTKGIGTRVKFELSNNNVEYLM
jgi:ribosome biogenesis SPOUT family RNA methylase Rps3